MSTHMRIAVYTILVATLATFAAAAIIAQRAEQVATKTYKIGTIGGTGTFDSPTNLFVVETEFACVYVAHRSGTRVAITALTKVTRGAGC